MDNLRNGMTRCNKRFACTWKMVVPTRSSRQTCYSVHVRQTFLQWWDSVPWVCHQEALKGYKQGMYHDHHYHHNLVKETVVSCLARWTVGWKCWSPYPQPWLGVHCRWVPEREILLSEPACLLTEVCRESSELLGSLSQWFESGRGCKARWK